MRPRRRLGGWSAGVVLASALLALIGFALVRAVTVAADGSGTSASISFARRNIAKSSPDPVPQVR